MVSAANGVAARFGSSVRAAALAGGGPPCGSAHSFQNPPFRRACPAGCIRNYSQHFFALNVRPGRQRGALWWTGCKRKAVACMAQRAERRRRRNHPPGPAAIVPPRQPYFVILNEVKNLFPCEPEAACGLCRARRRKTNEVQSRICLRILLYRFFVALLLRMTNY